MRLTTPRLRPLQDDEIPQEARELLDGIKLGSGRILNIFRTLAHHPKLMRRWLVFGNHILGKNSLTPRDREIAILRIGWLCKAEYEWGQHVEIGRAVGMTDEDFDRIEAGPDAEGLDPFEASILRAVDELHADAMISDATWSELAARYNHEQLLDFVFTVGQYNLVSMALNTLGVQLDPGIKGFDRSA